MSPDADNMQQCWINLREILIVTTKTKRTVKRKQAERMVT